MVTTLRLVPAVRPVLVKLWATSPDHPWGNHIFTIEYRDGGLTYLAECEFDCERYRLVDWRPAGIPEWIVDDICEVAAEVVHDGDSKSRVWAGWTEAN